MLYKSQHQSI